MMSDKNVTINCVLYKHKVPKWQYDALLLLCKKHQLNFYLTNPKNTFKKSLIHKLYDAVDKRFFYRIPSRYVEGFVDIDEVLVLGSQVNQDEIVASSDTLLFNFTNQKLEFTAKQELYFTLNGSRGAARNKVFEAHCNEDMNLCLEFNHRLNDINTVLIRRYCGRDDFSARATLHHLFAKQVRVLDDWINGSRVHNTTIDFVESRLSFKSQFSFVFKIFTGAFKRVLNKAKFVLAIQVNESYEEIDCPKGQLWADPFLYAKNDKTYVFFEDKKIGGKGKIRCGILNGLDILESEIVIPEEGHFSYPFLIEQNEKLYMIPETEDKREIAIYECDEFPYKWTLKKKLLDNIQAVDTTILYKDNIWWMFTNKGSHEELYMDELHIYYNEGDLITGSWHEHPKNPVVSNPKTARMGGAFIPTSEGYFRVSQNCYGAYGRNVTFHKIETLSKTEYKEETKNEMHPTWDKKYIGLHTYNALGETTIIDLRKFVSR